MKTFTALISVLAMVLLVGIGTAHAIFPADNGPPIIVMTKSLVQEDATQPNTGTATYETLAMTGGWTQSMFQKAETALLTTKVVVSSSGGLAIGAKDRDGDQKITKGPDSTEVRMKEAFA